jgi:hypothetical protein
MRHTIPYTAITEALDSVIANEIDRLEEGRDTAQELDVITDEEVEKLQNFIDQLEAIRGEINE